MIVDRFSKLVLMMFVGLLLAGPVSAQNDPPLPAPLKHLSEEGAQMRYLGQSNGLDGWISIKGGQEQYFYVTPDGRAFVMGLLFDGEGRLQTARQVRALQESSEGETLDMFASLNQAKNNVPDNPAEMVSREFKTPSEQLFSDVETSNWVPLGKSDAPHIYTFIDPKCQHCHAFINDLKRSYIDNGLIQVRMIPVGFLGEEAMAQAAFLLAVPNPQKRWYDHLAGDESALVASPDINQQGVQRNMSIMQTWQVNVTPFTVYKAKSGEVKIVQGRAQNIGDILTDIR